LEVDMNVVMFWQRGYLGIPSVLEGFTYD
jgi:hypothetical protein